MSYFPLLWRTRTGIDLLPLCERESMYIQILDFGSDDTAMTAFRVLASLQMAGITWGLSIEIELQTFCSKGRM